MKTITRITSILVCLILLSSCTQSVDYQLEKDNFKLEIITTTLEVKEDGTAFDAEEIYNQRNKVRNELLYYKGIPFTGEGVGVGDDTVNTSTGKYKEGKKYGTHKFYRGLSLNSVKNYKNGTLDGLSEGYYENGNLLNRINYKDGEFFGEYEIFLELPLYHLLEKHYWKTNKQEVLVEEVYYPNGQLKWKRFKNKDENGYGVGVGKYYYESGALKQIQNYEGNGGNYNPLIDEKYYENGKTKRKQVNGLALMGGLETLVMKEYDTLGKLTNSYEGPTVLENCRKVAEDYLENLNIEILWLNDKFWDGRVEKFMNGQYYTYDIQLIVEKNEDGLCKVTGHRDNSSGSYIQY
tara:strand:- start:115 stop:1164 length:1050 start_codon:yes stop_codon:yes gene_type:complete